MSHPKVNRYRSGVKNPLRQVITSENDDGTFTVGILDWGKMRLLKHDFPGVEEIEESKVDRDSINRV